MKTQKTVRVCLWITFAVYGFALVYILFLNQRGGRYPYESFWEYMRYSVNLIPFKTIWGYVADYMEKGSWILTLAIRNIFGNFVLFFPMGMFLPCLFSQAQKFSKTVPISVCTIFGVEILQLLLRRGIFDVDDLILNIAGWLLGFVVLKIPFINRLLMKSFLLPKEK